MRLQYSLYHSSLNIGIHVRKIPGYISAGVMMCNGTPWAAAEKKQRLCGSADRGNRAKGESRESGKPETVLRGKTAGQSPPRSAGPATGQSGTEGGLLRQACASWPRVTDPEGEVRKTLRQGCMRPGACSQIGQQMRFNIFCIHQHTKRMAAAILFVFVADTGRRLLFTERAPSGEAWFSGSGRRSGSAGPCSPRARQGWCGFRCAGPDAGHPSACR